MILAGTTALVWTINRPLPLQPENTSLGKMTKMLPATTGAPPRTPRCHPPPTPAFQAPALTNLNLLNDLPTTLSGPFLRKPRRTHPLDLEEVDIQGKCHLCPWQHGEPLLIAWRHQVDQLVEGEAIQHPTIAKLIQNLLENPTRQTSLP